MPAFSYTGSKENSFTWSNMSEGLEMQIPILDSLRKENKIRVETLGESGAWFKERFKVTPPTAVTTLTDVRGEGNKTVWFNSRFIGRTYCGKGEPSALGISIFSTKAISPLIWKSPETGISSCSIPCPSWTDSCGARDSIVPGFGSSD